MPRKMPYKLRNRVCNGCSRQFLGTTRRCPNCKDIPVIDLPVSDDPLPGLKSFWSGSSCLHCKHLVTCTEIIMTSDRPTVCMPGHAEFDGFIESKPAAQYAGKNQYSSVGVMES